MKIVVNVLDMLAAGWSLTQRYIINADYPRGKSVIVATHEGVAKTVQFCFDNDGENIKAEYEGSLESCSLLVEILDDAKTSYSVRYEAHEAPMPMKRCLKVKED